MSRHTQSDGITPDPRITPGLFDEHWPLLGPSPRLIGDYYKRDLPWEIFRARYLGELAEADKSREVGKLIKLAFTMDVVILCIERAPGFCHRRLLAEECRGRRPDLISIIE
jgi:uncharacterized protein YeaO (DUF488 family)